MRIKADLHVHSRHSDDGTAGLDTILRFARKRELSAVAICDHNSCASFDEIAKRRGPDGKIGGVLTIPGVELSTDAGHLLGLFLDKTIDFSSLALSGKLFTIKSAVAAIHLAGGLAVIAHPFGFSSGSARLSGEVTSLIDGVECCNARAMTDNPESSAKAATYAFSKGKLFTAGSDAHFGHEIGNAFIELEVGELSVRALKSSILEKKGLVWGRESCLVYRGLSQLCKRYQLKKYSEMPKRGAVTIYFLLLDAAKAMRLIHKDRGTTFIKGGQNKCRQS